MGAQDGHVSIRVGGIPEATEGLWLQDKFQSFGNEQLDLGDFRKRPDAQLAPLNVRPRVPPKQPRVVGEEKRVLSHILRFLV